MSRLAQPKNWIDRTLEAVAPGWAMRRYQARASIEFARSIRTGRGANASYRGAVSTRGSEPWGSSTSYRGGTSRDRRDLAEMRDRARQVYRDNAIGRSLLVTETDNIVAEGFTLQMDSGDVEFDKEAEARFYKWLETADVSRNVSAPSSLFRMSWQEPRKDGDGGFLLLKRGGYPKLQYIPGDLIRNPYKGYDFRTMFDGVETDPSGRPIRFWIRDVDEAGKDTVTDFPARDFVYFAHLDDPLAARGSTVYGPIFELLDQLDSYRDSVTKTAILACIFGLIEKRRNPAAALSALDTIENASGVEQKTITYENGMLKVMGTDEGVYQVQANQPMQQTPEFMRALSRIAAIGFDMPLEVALRDLSQVNFSGGQLGMKGYERTCRVRQDWLKTPWNRIVFWWLSVEKQRQELGFADAFKRKFPEKYGNFELHAREWLLRDRLGEAKADLMEYAIGVGNPIRACGQRSIDYKENLKQRAQAWKDNEGEGLPNVLPTDTRDSTIKVTALDADGNPLNQNQPLNGVQITSAMDVLAKVSENTIPEEAAIEMLSRLGIAPDRATAIVKSAKANRTGISASDREYQRAVLLKLLDVPGAKQTIYNLTDLEDLIGQTGLPPEKPVDGKALQAPFLPVVGESGPLVTGEVVKDSQGDIVGGDVEDPPAPPPAPPALPAPDPGPTPAEQQQAALNKLAESVAAHTDRVVGAIASQPAPQFTVNLPTQAAPQVTVEPAQVNVTTPPVTVHPAAVNVKVEAPPPAQVNVTTPPVTVNLPPAAKKKIIKYDQNDNPTEITEE